MTEEPQIPDNWSKAEHWAWKRIEAGEVADFNEREREEDPAFEDLDPREAEGWNDSRRLSIRFLQTILTEKCFADATPFTGVKIIGALVDGDAPLDLAHARIERLFWLEKSRLLVSVDCSGLRINDQLSFQTSYLKGSLSLFESRINGNLVVDEVLCQSDVNLSRVSVRGVVGMFGSTFNSKLSMNGIEIGQDLFMHEKASFREVDLRGAKIGGQLSMRGSTFDGEVNMNGSEVGQILLMDEKASFKQVNLVGAKIHSQLSMRGSTFNGEVNLNGIEVGPALLMDEKAFFKEVNLANAEIQGGISMSGSSFDGKVNMNGVEVGQGLLMDEQAIFKEIDLAGASINGQLSMSRSTFDGAVNMNGIKVNQTLFMDQQASFKDVDLIGAKIGGQLAVVDGIFDGAVSMDSIEIGQSLFARNTRFPSDHEVGLSFAHVGYNLDLSGATIGAIDLSGASIDGDLRLGTGKGHKPSNWVSPSRMTLRNTNVGAIQDAGEVDDCWPDHLELEGFDYRRLGGLGATESANIGSRSSAWFASWLARDGTASPQPYEHLAKVLRGTGYPRKADDVLYISRKRAHRRALKEGEWFRWLGMGLLRWTTGFGLGRRYFRSLLWVLVFTLVGVGVFGGALPAERLDLPSWLPVPPASASGTATTGGTTAAPMSLLELVWASFDQLLPIITLNKAHETLITSEVLPLWALSYFYFQRLVGWVLGSFLVAGFAGLTQKN